jgi:hypothetical protein
MEALSRERLAMPAVKTIWVGMQSILDLANAIQILVENPQGRHCMGIADRAIGGKYRSI